MTASPFLPRFFCRLRHVLAASLLFLFAVVPARAAPAPGVVEAVSYGTTVDLAAGIATFAIRFDRFPDLTTPGESASGLDSFQVWTDTVSTNPIQSTYAGIFGNGPLGTQAVLTSAYVPQTHKLAYLAPRLVSEADPDDPAWGPVVGRARYTLTADNTVSFDVPLALLHAADGHFNYGFETYRDGRWGGNAYFGVSGVAYPVPEPSAALLLAAGLALCAAGRAGATRVR